MLDSNDQRINQSEVARMQGEGYTLFSVTEVGTAYMYRETDDHGRRCITTIKVPPAICPARLAVMPDGGLKAEYIWGRDAWRVTFTSEMSDDLALADLAFREVCLGLCESRGSAAS